MKNIVFIILVIILYSSNIIAQETHTYGPVKENNFSTWIKEGSSTPRFWFTGHACGFVNPEWSRNINYWTWDYEDIPTEATVTEVKVRFKAYKNSGFQDLKLSLHNIPQPYSAEGINFFDECKTENIIYEIDEVHTNGVVLFEHTFTQNDGSDVVAIVNSAVQSGNYYFTLGLKAIGATILSPDWEFRDYNDNGGSNNPAIDLTINYTTPFQNYILTNKIESTTNYGNLIVNEDEQHPIASNNAAALSLNSENTVRTAELPFMVDWNSTGATQKHQNWQPGTLAKEHVLNFSFTANLNYMPADLKASFLSTKPATIGTNLIDGGNGGQFEFKDPWYYYLNNNVWAHSNVFKPYTDQLLIENNQSSSYGGILLDQDYNVPGQPYYSVKVAQTQDIYLSQTGRTHKFYFQNWSTSGANVQSSTALETPVVFTASNAEVKANYKGTQLSDNSNAYVSSSQRKFVYNHSSYCRVSVYESLGKIWLEGSYDDGTTWEILNNGTPLSGNGTASDPSIANAGDNQVVVVYQENNDMRVIIYSLNTPDPNPIKENKVVHTLFTANAKPVVERQINYTDNTELYLIVWDEDYYNAFAPGGLYYRCLERSVDGYSYSYDFINYRTKISNTDANSTNPALAAKEDHTYLHIAWEQQLNTYESEIRYYKINRSSTNTLSFSYYYKPSLGNVFLINSNPTMTVVDNGGMYMTWVGSSHESEDPPFKQVIMRCRHDGNWWYSTFFKYGSAVNNVSINSAEYPNQYYYGLAWVENGNTNYYKASTISGIQTLNTTGNYVQLSNGLGSCNNMQAMTFKNTTIPYAFTVSEKFGTGLSKENSTQDFEGREGIVSYPTKDNEKVERYYFTFSDIEVDGKPIKFVELDEMVMINDIIDLNNYLTTESFELASISELTYNASFGLSDGDKEEKLIDNGKKVKFGVELVDSESEKVLGVYNEVDFKNGTFLSKNKNACKIIPNLKENKKVKLRLVVEDQEKGQYLISSIMSKSNVLNKEGTFEIVNSENLVVTEYQLSQNYPNPFNPQTTINYQLPQDGLVTLKVYDALGKEVAELVNGYKGAGSYDVIFDGSNLASGIYFYKITAGEFMTTKKLMLMK
jgi:hypothetical protein